MQLLSPFFWSLPFLLIGGGVFLSRIIAVPVWKVLLWGTAPLLALLFEGPFVGIHPFYLVCAGWATLGTIALGNRLGQVLLGLLDVGGQVTRLLYAVAATVVLLGITITFLVPSWSASLTPTLQSTCVLGLAACAMFGLAVSSARVIRSLAPAVLWAGALLLVSTESVLQKIPGDSLVDEVSENAPLVPRNRLESVLADLQERTSKLLAGNVSSIVVLSGNGSSVVDFGKGVADAVSRSVSLTGDSIPVAALSGKWIGIEDLNGIAEGISEKLKPSVIVVTGWASNAVEGWNSYGIPGASESEARGAVARLSWIDSIPFLSRLLESRLYKSLAFVLSPSDATASGEILRSSAEEYGQSLSALIGTLKHHGHTVVLVAEPRGVLFPLERAQAFVSQMERVASETGAGFVDLVNQEHDVSQTDLVHRIFEQALRAGPTIVSSFPQRALKVLSGSVGEHRWIENMPHVSSEVTGTVQVPQAGNGYFKVVLGANGKFIDDKRFQGDKEYGFRATVPPSIAALPLVEFSIETIPSPGDELDRVGGTDFRVPVPLLINVSGEGGEMYYRSLGHRDISAGTKSCILVVAIDARTGDSIDWYAGGCSDTESAAAARFIRAQPWGTIVAVGSRKVIESDSLRSALRYLGVPGENILLSANFVALGATGVGGSKAMYVTGGGALQIRRGSDWSWRAVEFSLMNGNGAFHDRKEENNKPDNNEG